MGWLKVKLEISKTKKDDDLLYKMQIYMCVKQAYAHTKKGKWRIKFNEYHCS